MGRVAGDRCRRDGQAREGVLAEGTQYIYFGHLIDFRD